MFVCVYARTIVRCFRAVVLINGLQVCSDWVADSKSAIYISGAFMKPFSNHKPRMLNIIIFQMNILGVSTICLMFLSLILTKAAFI